MAKAHRLPEQREIAATSPSPESGMDFGGMDFGTMGYTFAATQIGATGQSAAADDPDALAAASSGHSLPDDLPAGMDDELGAQLATVEVHTDKNAAALAQHYSAQAFTVGNDIFFADGAYNPSSSDGAELIAHEASHVLQQGGSGAPLSSPKIRQQMDDLFWRETRAMAIERAKEFYQRRGTFYHAFHNEENDVIHAGSLVDSAFGRGF